MGIGDGRSSEDRDRSPPKKMKFSRSRTACLQVTFISARGIEVCSHPAVSVQKIKMWCSSTQSLSELCGCRPGVSVACRGRPVVESEIAALQIVDAWDQGGDR
jgi:hypothetical protein